jgi:hypothetical protein
MPYKTVLFKMALHLKTLFTSMLFLVTPEAQSASLDMTRSRWNLLLRRTDVGRYGDAVTMTLHERTNSCGEAGLCTASIDFAIGVLLRRGNYCQIG